MGQVMKKVFELVKTLDFEPIDAGDGEDFRFRLEIFRQMDGAFFFGKVFRMETCRLQPTFPQTAGILPEWKNDALFFVLDEAFDPEQLQATSWEEVVAKCHSMIEKSFNK